ncbi:MAG: metallophosphoesterase [Fimbriimonadaceae bacterium]|nr:metallophosphoesterase [Fimbriimonadaceae bacterium]
MKVGKVLLGAGLVGAGVLVYGALVESKKLTVERYTLRLRGWPESLRGFRIALLADFHVRDRYTFELAQRAVSAALDESPDMVVIAGDFVGHWKEDVPHMLGEVLEPLLIMEGNVVAIPGNHDYYGFGDPSLLEGICDALNIKFLRNESWLHQGIRWVGIDSANEGRADLGKAFAQPEDHHPDAPIVALWHEPDLADLLPVGVDLVLSGHSHGGQFLTPWGWAPMHTENGKRYVRGFYPEAPTPIFVTRGVGTTGPPSRLFCRPEVAILTLT